jgi:hypothetical protein
MLYNVPRMTTDNPNTSRTDHRLTTSAWAVYCMILKTPAPSIAHGRLVIS